MKMFDQQNFEGLMRQISNKGSIRKIFKKSFSLKTIWKILMLDSSDCYTPIASFFFAYGSTLNVLFTYVLHLLKHTSNLYLSRYSMDLR